MRYRAILCEGPEDVAAVRAIAQRFFDWSTLLPRDASRVPRGVGEERRVDLVQPGVLTVEILAVPGAKSNLPNALQLLLRAYASPFEGVGVLFDPDVEPEGDQHARVAAALAELAPKWQFVDAAPRTHVARWTAPSAPQVSALTIHSIPWRANGRLVDDLEDAQHLERIVCEILARRHPQLAELVERWLVEMRDDFEREPSWKSALHLWCALIDPKQTTTTVVERALGQAREMRAHAEAVLQTSTLLEDFRPLLTRA